jgi:hypothetical protein
VPAVRTARSFAAHAHSLPVNHSAKAGFARHCIEKDAPLSQSSPSPDEITRDHNASSRSPPEEPGSRLCNKGIEEKRAATGTSLSRTSDSRPGRGIRRSARQSHDLSCSGRRFRRCTPALMSSSCDLFLRCRNGWLPARYFPAIIICPPLLRAEAQNKRCRVDHMPVKKNETVRVRRSVLCHAWHILVSDRGSFPP